MERLMHYVIFAGMMLAVYLFIMPAKAATVWTPQEGIYQKQKSVAGKVRYVLLKEVKIVPLAAEIVQDGYKQVPIDTVITGNVIPPECEGKFYCDAEWGVIVKLEEMTLGDCKRMSVKKIDLTDSNIYSGMQVLNGEIKCMP